MSVNTAIEPKKYFLDEIPENSFFSKTVFLDNKFVLTAPEMCFDQSLIKALKEWDFKEVISSGRLLKEYAEDKDDKNDDITPAEASIASDSVEIKEASRFYSLLYKFVETLFMYISVNNELDYNAAADQIKESCEIIKEYRRYLLRIIRNMPEKPNENYLVSHTVKSTIISIILGAYLKLPNHRLIELGVAALLHETGMLKLPQQLYLTERILQPHEKKIIMAHPLLGYNMLRSLNLPLTAAIGALEHHERENGSGYPRQLTGDKISLYGKIIAVACSYEALSSKRPHKEAKDGYTGMLELLKNEGKQYDDTVVRALVYSLSIYPIGLYVLLSSGRKGQVVDVNPENPSFPIVQIFGELTPDGKNKILETSAEGISIIRPLSRDEIGSP